MFLKFVFCIKKEELSRTSIKFAKNLTGEGEGDLAMGYDWIGLE